MLCTMTLRLQRIGVFLFRFCILVFHTRVSSWFFYLLLLQVLLLSHPKKETRDTSTYQACLRYTFVWFWVPCKESLKSRIWDISEFILLLLLTLEANSVGKGGEGHSRILQLKYLVWGSNKSSIVQLSLLSLTTWLEINSSYSMVLL